MTIMAQGASRADALRNSQADLIMLAADAPSFVGEGSRIKGAAVVYLIDSFCIYAKCTHATMPDSLRLTYQLASESPEGSLDRELVNQRMREAAA